MGRLLRVFAVVLAIVPAVGVLAAVQATPRSAYSVPSFEVRTATRTIRLTGADLGVYRTPRGISFDPNALGLTLSRLDAIIQTPAKADWYALDRAATRALLQRVAHGSTTNLVLPLRRVPVPAAPRDAVVVRLSEFHLDLYNHTQLIDHFPVGVGRLRFATPPGAYYVKYKERNPSWRNPGSSWAHDMPWYMPPGPRNPLGTRALGLDRGALVIHGTPEPWTVGFRSSHGCIRMRRADVERLFELVPQGTPVFIVP
jgi:lipoprotein-anchoring transpeptidase ErfK/SrfK